MKRSMKALLAGTSLLPILAVPAYAQIDEIIVTAEKRAESSQDVSISMTALSSEDIELAGIQDITRLEHVVPGLRVGSSGGEVRPALRGARTNEVGVAGTGIAEQVVGIFQDGIYVPTTTAGLGAYADVARIEVLRGPQGTLYGRNTFAGTINVITNEPNFDGFSGRAKVTMGDYSRLGGEAVLNVPISDNLAARFVAVSDRHDGYVRNLTVPGTSDDLKEKNQQFFRSTVKYENDSFDAMLRYEYSNKDANSDAIWGYQQIAGYQIVPDTANPGMFLPNAVVTPGHIYSPGGIAQNQPDPGPYEVYRNAVSWDEQETNSITLRLGTSLGGFADAKWTTNYSKLSGSQFYDNDYSPGGFDHTGGFGRQDDHKTWSTELQLTSAGDGPLSWVAGAYYFDQEADWEWLWRTDRNLDGDPATTDPDTILVPSWGNPNHDPHTVKSFAVFGQATFDVAENIRLIGGLRYNDDSKTFTGSIPDWSDDAVLWKVAGEFDVSDNAMLYANAATGYRTGGANDGRVVSRGAQPLYDNETVTSYEVGYKSTLMDNRMVFNAAAYMNKYDDVKAQLFAVACSDITQTDVLTCDPRQTFEYYQNGGDSTTTGVELELQYAPNDRFRINGSLAWMDAEFDDGYTVGTDLIRPLLGLGNFEGRQNINDPNGTFDFSGWAPAMSPDFSLSLNASYDFDFAGGTLTPYLQTSWVDDYYTFDVNIPETLQNSHTKTDLRLTWRGKNGVMVEGFILNVEDEAVLARTVVHSQILNGNPINSVQANWSPPRTMGVSVGVEF